MEKSSGSKKRKKEMNLLKKIILFLWQLPQNIAGWIVLLFTRANKDETNEVYRWCYGSGLSLGNFVFVNHYTSGFIVKHEKGHQKQSLYLGWLYLLVIGLPSLIWCMLWSAFWRDTFNYYSFYTEKWANRLSSIKV